MISLDTVPFRRTVPYYAHVYAFLYWFFCFSFWICRNVRSLPFSMALSVFVSNGWIRWCAVGQPLFTNLNGVHSCYQFVKWFFWMCIEVWIVTKYVEAIKFAHTEMNLCIINLNIKRSANVRCSMLCAMANRSKHTEVTNRIQWSAQSCCFERINAWFYVHSNRISVWNSFDLVHFVYRFVFGFTLLHCYLCQRMHRHPNHTPYLRFIVGISLNFLNTFPPLISIDRNHHHHHHQHRLRCRCCRHFSNIIDNNHRNWSKLSQMKATKMEMLFYKGKINIF